MREREFTVAREAGFRRGQEAAIRGDLATHDPNTDIGAFIRDLLVAIKHLGSESSRIAVKYLEAQLARSKEDSSSTLFLKDAERDS